MGEVGAGGDFKVAKETKYMMMKKVTCPSAIPNHFPLPQPSERLPLENDKHTIFFGGTQASIEAGESLDVELEGGTPLTPGTDAVKFQCRIYRMMILSKFDVVSSGSFLVHDQTCKE